MKYKTMADTIGGTPLVRLQRLLDNSKCVLLAKLEGNNPAGSVKDRPAYNMLHQAQLRGVIEPGDTLIEATSGNTGIAFAMVAAIEGYRVVLIMPEHMSLERRATMKAFGAEIVLVTEEQGMEGARDLALEMQRKGEGIVLDQFANLDNPGAHYKSTAKEILQDTDARVTHVVSSMGTTGTMMGVSAFFQKYKPSVQMIGVLPKEGSQIPGIRAWAKEYQPKIYNEKQVTKFVYVSRLEAEVMMRRMAREEGVFCGISSGGCMHAALSIAKTLTEGVVVSFVCDRGDRYISSGVFPA